ncbi:MAG: prepilin-type N-terminal cleavage/methylation domain-containing protein [Planctomycetota bacterium]
MPSPRLRFRARPVGFTLIELIVVIGIIALLIGILLPVLSSAKQAAIKVHCSSQIRQINLALETYANDFRGRYPVAGYNIDWGQIDTGFPNSTQMPSWMEQLFTYLPSQEVLSGCHSYPRDTPYHYFLSTRAVWIATGNFGSIRQQQIRNTSAFVLVGDNHWDFYEDVAPDADKDDYTQQTLSLTAGPNHWEPQHVKGLNVGFADGHVASFLEIDPTRMTWRYDSMSLW